MEDSDDSDVWEFRNTVPSDDSSDDNFQESRYSLFFSPNRERNSSQKSSRNIQKSPQDDRRKNSPGSSKANYCNHCGKDFRDTDALLHHLYENLNVPKKENRAFYNLQSKKPMTISPQIFKCNICKEDFPNKRVAYMHYLQKHSEETNPLTFKYSLEDKLSSNEKGGKSPGLKERNYQQMYMCLKCSKVLAKDSLTIHKAQHSNVKNTQLFVKVNIPNLSNMKKRESTTLNLTQSQILPNKTTKQYMCVKCRKVFPNVSETVTHRAQVHPDITNLDLFVNVDVPHVQKEVTVSQPVGKIQNIPSVKQKKVQIQNKLHYMCLKCNVVFSTYYSATRHRKIEHPELPNCQLFTKVIVPNSQNLSANKSPKSFHKTGNRETTKAFLNENENIEEEVLHDENIEETPRKRKLAPTKYPAKMRKILQLTVEANGDVAENDHNEMSAENENKELKTVNIFQCSACDLHFISVNTIRKHFAECSSEVEIAKANCSKCRLLFSTDELYNHILKHHNNVNSEFTVTKVAPTVPHVDVNERTLFRCKICSVHFVSEKSLNIHMYKSKHDPLKQIKCRYCGLMFSKYSLAKHIDKHHEQLNLSREDLHIASYINPNLCHVEKEAKNIREEPTVTPQRAFEDRKQEEKKEDRRETVTSQNMNNNEISRDCTQDQHHDSISVGKDKAIEAVKTSIEPYGTSFDRKIYKCNLCSIHFMKKSFLLKHMTHASHCNNAKMKSRCDTCGLTFYKTSLNRHKFIHHQKMKLNREDFVVVKNNSPNCLPEKNKTVITKKQNVKNVTKESQKDNQAKISSPMQQYNKINKTQEDFEESEQSTDKEEKENNYSFKPTLDMEKVVAESKNIEVSDVYGNVSYLKADAMKLYKCGECDVYFTRQATCMIHVYQHKPLDIEDYIKCNDCGLQFKNTSLRQHREEQHTKDFNLEEVVVVEYQPNIRAEKPPTCVIYYGADRVQSSQVSTTSETSVVTKWVDTVTENNANIFDNDIPSGFTEHNNGIVTEVRYIENVGNRKYNEQIIATNQQICKESDMSNSNVNVADISTTSEPSVVTKWVDTVTENNTNIFDNDILSSFTEHNNGIVTEVQYIENVGNQESNEQIIATDQQICKESYMSNSNVNVADRMMKDKCNIVANTKHAAKYILEHSTTEKPKATKQSCDDLVKRNDVSESITPQVENRNLKIGNSPVSLAIEELNRNQADKSSKKNNSNITHEVIEANANQVTDINTKDNITLRFSHNEMESDADEIDETIENIIEFMDKQNLNKTKETNDKSLPTENIENSHLRKKSRTLEDIVQNIHAKKNINEPILVSSQVFVDNKKSFGETLGPANKPLIEDILNVSTVELNMNTQIANSCVNIEPKETSYMQDESYKERDTEITYFEIPNVQILANKHTYTPVIDNNILVKSIEIRKNQTVNTSLLKTDECRKETTEMFVENVITAECANVDSDSVKEDETREKYTETAASFDKYDETTKSIQTGILFGTELTNPIVNICALQNKSNNSAKLNIIENIIINRDNFIYREYHESIKALSMENKLATSKESMKNIIDKEISSVSTDFAETITNNNKTVKLNAITQSLDVPKNFDETAYMQNVIVNVKQASEKQLDVIYNRACNTERDEIVDVLNENIEKSKCNETTIFVNETSQLQNITNKREKINKAVCSKTQETDEDNTNAFVGTQIEDNNSCTEMVADSNGSSTTVRELIVSAAELNLSKISSEINTPTLITPLLQLSDSDSTDSKLAEESIGVLTKDITHNTAIRKNIDEETDSDVEIVDVIQTETPITIEDSDGETDDLTMPPESVKKEKLWPSELTETTEACNTNVIQIDDDTSDISRCIDKLINTLNKEPDTSKKRQRRTKSIGNERDIIQIDNNESIQITNTTVKQEIPYAIPKKLSGNRNRASIHEPQAFINLDSDDEAEYVDVNGVITIKKEKTFDKGCGKRNEVVLTEETIVIYSDDEG